MTAMRTRSTDSSPTCTRSGENRSDETRTRRARKEIMEDDETTYLKPRDSQVWYPEKPDDRIAVGDIKELSFACPRCARFAHATIPQSGPARTRVACECGGIWQVVIDGELMLEVTWRSTGQSTRFEVEEVEQLSGDGFRCSGPGLKRLRPTPKRGKRAGGCIGCLLGFLLATAAAAEDRLTIGARVQHTMLSESRRGQDSADRDQHFLGSLWGLDPVQRYVPAPFLEVRLVRSFGLGVSYDKARIRTLDWANASHTTTAGDGDLVLRGAELYAFASVPLSARLTAYAQIGRARYWSDFEELPEWPGRFAVSDTAGWTVATGARIAIRNGFRADVLYEHRRLTQVAATANADNGVRTDGAFPVRGHSVSAGFSYSR